MNRHPIEHTSTVIRFVVNKTLCLLRVVKLTQHHDATTMDTILAEQGTPDAHMGSVVTHVLRMGRCMLGAHFLRPLFVETVNQKQHVRVTEWDVG